MLTHSVSWFPQTFVCNKRN